MGLFRALAIGPVKGDTKSLDSNYLISVCNWHLL